MVEQLICNHQVVSSSLTAGSTLKGLHLRVQPFFRLGQSNTKDALKFKRAVQYTAQYLIVKGLDQNFVNKLYSDINDTLSKETKESYIGHFSTEVSQSDTSIYNYLINIIKELNGAKQIIDKVRQWRDDYKDI